MEDLNPWDWKHMNPVAGIRGPSEMVHSNRKVRGLFGRDYAPQRKCYLRDSPKKVQLPPESQQSVYPAAVLARPQIHIPQHQLGPWRGCEEQ